MSASLRPVALTGADQAVNVGAGIYYGFAIRETAGAAAVVRIYDNAAAATGTLVDVVALAANESARECYPGHGIWCTAGIYVKVVSGAVEGSVRVG